MRRWCRRLTRAQSSTNKKITDMHRNTALRCGNPRSFTLSKLPQVILARLVLLASTQFLKRWICCAILCRAYISLRSRTFRYAAIREDTSYCFIKNKLLSKPTKATSNIHFRIPPAARSIYGFFRNRARFALTGELRK